MLSFDEIKKGISNPKLAAEYIYDNHINPTEQVFLNETILREVLWLNDIYRRIDEVPGHVVELGVGPGTNSIIFGNLIKLYGDDDIRMYYGFDTFDGYRPEDIRSSPHLSADAWKDLDYDEVSDTLASHGVDKVTELIEGDLKRTLPNWLNTADTHRRTPNSFHVALLYVDCNSYKAASTGMDELFEYLSPGAIVCVDELKQGGETRALREFCEKHDTPFKKGKSPAAGAPYTIVD